MNNNLSISSGNIPVHLNTVYIPTSDANRIQCLAPHLIVHIPPTFSPHLPVKLLLNDAAAAAVPTSIQSSWILRIQILYSILSGEHPHCVLCVCVLVYSWRIQAIRSMDITCVVRIYKEHFTYIHNRNETPIK